MHGLTPTALSNIPPDIVSNIKFISPNKPSTPDNSTPLINFSSKVFVANI